MLVLGLFSASVDFFNSVVALCLLLLRSCNAASEWMSSFTTQPSPPVAVRASGNGSVAQNSASPIISSFEGSTVLLMSF